MKMLCLCALALSAGAIYADSSAEIKSFEQGADSAVTVTYTLSKDAIVTLSVQVKESGEWKAIDDSRLDCVSGDVNREVSATLGDEVRTIVWHPDYTAIGDILRTATIRPILTIWPKDDPPDYMVVDLAVQSSCRVRYYASTNALPGGLLDNPDYRTTKLVLRKIPAKGVTWMMGSESEVGRNRGSDDGRTEVEKLHEVKFDSNYYMAVFQTTQAQWMMVKRVDDEKLLLGLGKEDYQFTNEINRMLFPLNAVSYCDVRENSGNTPNANHEYPKDPHPDSFLGILRSRTGLLDFDIPSDAEWEYACRAGNGENLWGSGTVYEDKKSYDARIPGCYQYNQASQANMKIVPVGSYAPNSWGLYDMHGNVFEWCLDWFTEDNTELKGRVNTESGLYTLKDGVYYKRMVRRGGAFNLPASWLRSACRAPEAKYSRGNQNGFRVKFGAAISK